MERRMIIDLTKLAHEHSTEVSRILSGIVGETDCALWTSQMRSAVRGGKPLGGPRIEESADGPDQN
jgi:hypothetical protein